MKKSLLKWFVVEEMTSDIVDTQVDITFNGRVTILLVGLDGGREQTLFENVKMAYSLCLAFVLSPMEMPEAFRLFLVRKCSNRIPTAASNARESPSLE